MTSEGGIFRLNGKDFKRENRRENCISSMLFVRTIGKMEIKCFLCSFVSNSFHLSGLDKAPGKKQVKGVVSWPLASENNSRSFLHQSQPAPFIIAW